MLDPNNSNNPFDYAGRVHNELVEDYLQAYGNIIETPDTIFTKVFQNVVNKPEYTTHFPNAPQPISLSNAEILSWFNDKDNDYQNKFAALSLSPIVMQPFSQVVVATLNTSLTAQDYHNLVLGVESTFISQGVGTAQEQETVLSLTSIARHSNHYWENKDDNVVLKRCKKPNRRKVLVVGADIIGGALGFILGGGGSLIPGAAGGSSIANTLLPDMPTPGNPL